MKCINKEDITVYQFTWSVIDSNSYVIKKNKSALIVDPIDSNELFSFVSECNSISVVLTHAHFDHICGLNKLRETSRQVIVYASSKCSDNIQNPRKNLSNIGTAIKSFQQDCGKSLERIDRFSCEAADISFEKEFAFVWNGHNIKLEEYAGHSADSLCIIVDEKYLFSGDTILPIPTVTRLPGGSTKVFKESDLPRLKKMISKIELVFPGHQNPGKLEDMIKINMII